MGRDQTQDDGGGVGLGEAGEPEVVVGHHPPPGREIGDARRAPPRAIRTDHDGDGAGRGLPRAGHEIVQDTLERGPLEGALGTAAGSQRHGQRQGRDGEERRRGPSHDGRTSHG